MMATLALLLAGCAVEPLPPQETLALDQPVFKPPKTRRLVAVAGFSNRSTYAADKLWDTSAQLLTTQLVRSNYFRVVEWQRMKDLFDWEALSNCSLVESPESRRKAAKILLCEMFVGGSVTFFDVSQRAEVSALSKAKTIETTIRVDLWLQDAGTGEYLGVGEGEGTRRQRLEGGLAGGQTGSWDPKAADEALKMALTQATHRLIQQYSGREAQGGGTK